MRKRLVLVALLAAVTLMLGLVGCSSGDAAGGKAQEDVEGLPAWADELQIKLFFHLPAQIGAADYDDWDLNGDLLFWNDPPPMV